MSSEPWLSEHRHEVQITHTKKKWYFTKEMA